jgi:hypothetical protein
LFLKIAHALLLRLSFAKDTIAELDRARRERDIVVGANNVFPGLSAKAGVLFVGYPSGKQAAMVSL